MHNLSQEKIIIFILAIPLFVLSLFLVSFGDGLFAIGASDDEEYRRNTENTETIYERRDCADGACHDSGKKLIEFKGGDAECENYKSEDERMQCYSRNSQSSFSCPNLENSGQVSDCYENNSSPSFVQNQGGGGTLVVSNSVTVGGSRVYTNGFDCNGEHKIQTGTDAGDSTAITLRENSRDVEYNGNLSTGGNGTTVLSEDGGVYFGSEVEYGEDYLNEEEGLRGQTMTFYNNFNGLNLNGCRDMKVMSNHNNTITIPDDGDDYDDHPDHPNASILSREIFGAVEIEKGLEVNGDLKADFMYFQGRELKWSQPIRGHFVLYYDSPAEGPTYCGEPISERDAEPPVSTPSITSGGSSGVGGGSSPVADGSYDSNRIGGTGNSLCDDASNASVIPYDATRPDALDLGRFDISWYGGNADYYMGPNVAIYPIVTTITDDSTCGHYNFSTAVAWPEPTGNGINAMVVACGGSSGNYICQHWDWNYVTNSSTKDESCNGYFNLPTNSGYYGPEYYAFIVDVNGAGRTNVVELDIASLCGGP